MGRGWIYHATHSLPYGAGLATSAAALLGVIPFLRRHARAAIVLGSFAVPFYMTVGSGYTVFFRYVLPLIPLICLLAAFGAVVLSRWLARAGLTEVRALAVACVLTVGPGLVYSVWFDALLARTDTRVLAGEWLTPRLQSGATLHDAGGKYSKLDIWRTDVVRQEYDLDRNAFADEQLPEWLVLQSSPLWYTRRRRRLSLTSHVSATCPSFRCKDDGEAGEASTISRTPSSSPSAGSRTSSGRVRPSPSIVVPTCRR